MPPLCVCVSVDYAVYGVRRLVRGAADHAGCVVRGAGHRAPPIRLGRAAADGDSRRGRAGESCGDAHGKQFSVHLIRPPFLAICRKFAQVSHLQQKPQKKVPVRRCVGCNTQKPKKELVRIVRSPEGEVSVDLTGKRSGRGAYLCPSAACLAKARKAKRLEHAFGVPVPDEVFERLTEEMACAEQAVKEAMPRGE